MPFNRQWVNGAAAAKLQGLKCRTGTWHDLAKLLPKLAARGIDTAAVEEATGLERTQQNIMTVAASVRDTRQLLPGSLHARCLQSV